MASPSSRKKKQQRSIEFPVPQQLKQAPMHVKSIAIEDDSIVIEHKSHDKIDGETHDHIKFAITGNLEEDMTELRKWAKNNFFFIDNRDQFMIDELVNYVGALYVDGAARTIAQIKERNEAEAKRGEEEEEGKLKKRQVQKYYSSVEGVLYESVLIAGHPCFVSIQVDASTGEPFARAYEKIMLPEFSDKPIMELLPTDKETYLSKPYEFQSETDLNDYIKQASAETLDSLFVKVKMLASKYIVGSDNHLTILAADTILTYFEDKLGQVHYLYFYGDNDTGKTANLTFMDHVAYRAMFDIDITPANIFTYLGSIQEGQGIILEDEADNIDKNEEKMKIYKRGYNAGGTVTRTDLTFGRKQESYFVYCFKAYTAERTPDPDKAKGFNERTFYIECQSGTPEYDIVEVTTGAAGDSEFRARLAELQQLHKLLFAYRLLHHGDPLPDIKNISVKNREKQLTKPLLRLFQGAYFRKEIAKALAELLIKRRGVKKDTLDAKIYRVIKGLIDEQGGQIYKFTNSLIFTSVCEALDGKYKNEGKDQSFETPEHSFVSHKRITQICVDKFGARKESDGKTRYIVFDKDKLALVSDAYELANTLELLLNQGGTVGEEVGGGSEEPSRTLPDRSDAFYTSTEQTEVFAHDHSNENSTQFSNNSINEEQNHKEFDKIEGSEGSGISENGHAYSQDVSEVSDLSASNLEGSSSSIESVIQKAMLDQQGNNKGYFTKDDWTVRLLLLPNEHWTEDQAEQTLYALLQEGKLTEIELGKYKPDWAPTDR